MTENETEKLAAKALERRAMATAPFVFIYEDDEGTYRDANLNVLIMDDEGVWRYEDGVACNFSGAVMIMPKGDPIALYEEAKKEYEAGKISRQVLAQYKKDAERSAQRHGDVKKRKG